MLYKYKMRGKGNIMKILHLSDIHVCEENKEQLPVLCNSIITALYEYPGGTAKPDVVLITGDYTHRGTISELTLFKRAFKELLQKTVFKKTKYIILVPGNHDYPWDEKEEDRCTNFNEFVKENGKISEINDASIAQRIQDESISHMYEDYIDYRVLLIGMNSMKIVSKERKGIGYFDSKQLELVADIVNFYREKGTSVLYAFVAFHHHLLPVSFVERDTLKDAEKYSLTLDARRAIDTFLKNDIAFALHGHQHQPSLFTIIDDSGKHDDKSLHIIASGCLADRDRLNDSGRKSFFLYDISEGCMKAVMAETTRDDSDKFEWKPPRNYSLAVSSLPKIDKDRILNLAEKDNRWVRRVGEGQSVGDDIVSIEDLVKMLVDGIADDGSVSYYAGKKTRYRTSTLATVLECMADIKLLPREDMVVMQKKLIRLRDRTDEVIKTCDQDDVIEKAPEDNPAWGIDEAPSVWTTSKALTALFVTKYSPTSDDEVAKLRESILWLAAQQYSSGGWGYQNYQESEVCRSSIPMTALALRTLCLALQQSYMRIEENLSHTRIIYNAIKKGAKFILDKVVRDGENIYWKYMDKPSLSGSVWAHQALKDAEHLLYSYDSIFDGYAGKTLVKRFKKIDQNVLDYVVKHLPSEDSAEALTETFFHAPVGSSLKYKCKIVRKKDFKSFVPFVLSYLLKADPEYAECDEVKAMLKWVLNHKDTQWLLDDFNGESGDPCMISIAMSINIIVNWLQMVSNRALDKAISALMEEV